MKEVSHDESIQSNQFHADDLLQTYPIMRSGRCLSNLERTRLQEHINNLVQPSISYWIYLKLKSAVIEQNINSEKDEEMVRRMRVTMMQD